VIIEVEVRPSVVGSHWFLKYHSIPRKSVVSATSVRILDAQVTKTKGENRGRLSGVYRICVFVRLHASSVDADNRLVLLLVFLLHHSCYGVIAQYRPGFKQVVQIGVDNTPVLTGIRSVSALVGDASCVLLL